MEPEQETKPERIVRIEEARTAGNDGIEQAADALAVVRDRVETKPGRRESARVAILAAFFVSLVMMGVAIFISYAAFSSQQEQQATAAAQRAADLKDAQANQRLAQQAYDQAQAANQQLAARGQAPVPVAPPDPNDPTKTVANAAAATVLAGLPPLAKASDIGPAVAAYIMAHPQGPTAAQISDAVGGYLQANPPPKGDPGTNGKNGDNGRDGKDGADGRTPTAADIMAQVDAYCSTRNQCQGPPGERGPAGTSITSFDGFFANPDRQTGCELRITLFEAATGTTRQDAVMVPAQFCTTTPLPTTGG